MSPDKAAADGSVQVKVRAIASDGEVQDSKIEDMYNVRGLLNNSCDVLHFKMRQ